MVTRSSAVTKYAGAPYRKVEIMTWCVRFSFPCAHELARNRYIEHVTEATAAGRGGAGRGEARREISGQVTAARFAAGCPAAKRDSAVQR